MGCIANFMLFLTVKEFCRSVKFWPSYSKLNPARFLGRNVHVYHISSIRSPEYAEYYAEELSFIYY